MLILVISGVHGGVQFALSLWQPIVSNFIAGSLALVALYPLSRWRRYSEEMMDIEVRPAMAGEENARSQEEEDPPIGLGSALFPYGVLTAVAVVVLLVPSIEGWLENIGWGPPFPEVSTGYGVEREAKDSYSPITPLTHPGFFLLVACASTWAVYRVKGLLTARAGGSDRAFWPQLIEKAAPASAAIVAFLVMSKVLDHSGQARVLALGMSQVVPPMAYAALAGGIGALGGIITSSSTASNMLFAPIQQTVAEAQGLPEPAIIAAQSAGGATGNAAAPANVVLGTTTAGLAGREGEVLRRTLVWAAATTLATAGPTMLLVVLSGSGQ